MFFSSCEWFGTRRMCANLRFPCAAKLLGGSWLGRAEILISQRLSTFTIQSHNRDYFREGLREQLGGDDEGDLIKRKASSAKKVCEPRMTLTRAGRHQAMRFFMHHNDEEWFWERYHSDGQVPCAARLLPACCFPFTLSPV